MYVYEKASATGPYTRPAGAYTRYGDVRPLLTGYDDRLAVFGSGDEVVLDFDPAKLPALPKGWVRDYFFVANGYEKDMDFYAAEARPFSRCLSGRWAHILIPRAGRSRWMMRTSTISSITTRAISPETSPRDTASIIPIEQADRGLPAPG